MHLATQIIHQILLSLPIAISGFNHVPKTK